MNEKDTEVIEVRMLGGFAISYAGKEFTLGRGSTSKFLQLLQLVWLQGEKGITKDQLLQFLYDRESLSNSSNSLSNLLYQLRRQMVRAGLPEAEYISRKDGVYRVQEGLALRIDALEFKELAEEGRRLSQAGAGDRACSLFKQALELYQGSLLPAISTELWVVNESLRFKSLFEVCVKGAGDYYKQQRDYEAMYQIYTRAVELYPFDDWQTGQIDCLMLRGEYKEAFALYERTVNLYSEEMGLPPSVRLMRCYEEMGKRLESSETGLLDIISEFKEDSETASKPGEGAYYCAYPAFVDVYRFLKRTVKRSTTPVCLMLCTLVDYEGKPIGNADKLKARSEMLREAIRSCLRQGDVFTRYSTSQYLILLVGTSREDCDMVYRRLLKKLKALAGPRAELQYSVVALKKIGGGGTERPDPGNYFIESIQAIKVIQEIRVIKEIRVVKAVICMMTQVAAFLFCIMEKLQK